MYRKAPPGLMPGLHRIKAQSAPAVWLLSALMLFAPLGAHAVGAVLCIESDGEVTVERAVGSACTDGVNEPSPFDDTHCTACIDVPLPSGGDTDCASFKTENGPSAQTVLPVVSLLPALDRLPVQPPTSVSPRSGQAAAPSDPAPLRSVVLLI